MTGAEKAGTRSCCLFVATIRQQASRLVDSLIAPTLPPTGYANQLGFEVMFFLGLVKKVTPPDQFCRSPTQDKREKRWKPLAS